MKSALITGASRGIGKGIAEVFAKNGYNIAVGYLQSAGLVNEYCNELRETYGVDAIAVQGDVSKFEDCKKIVDQAIDKLGRLDVLVNNAAQYSRDPREEERARLALTKLNSVEFLSQLAHERGAEAVVNVSSMYTVNNRKSPFATAYQSGVESLTEHFAKQFRGKTRVNAVRPGACATDMVFGNYSPQEIEGFLDAVPDRKLIDPVQIGQVVYFLATNDLLTGQIVTADKGTTLHGD